MELEQLRQQMNELDKTLAAVYVKRLDLSREIAECKYAEQRRILDPARNEEIIANVTAAAPAEYTPYIRALYEAILHISRDFQRNVMIGEDEKKPHSPQDMD